mmetsp:Transcript_29520/g.42857  ORF Transcript_29520/g.42857 Transcript_29520/m.42857 type:complete len:511 (+) Transcript_29520:39-1571(+)
MGQRLVCCRSARAYRNEYDDQGIIEDLTKTKKEINGTVFYSTNQTFFSLQLAHADLDDAESMLDSTSSQLDYEADPSESTNGIAATGGRKDIVSTGIFQTQLEGTKVAKVQDRPNGFPGYLTKEQLEICLSFRQWLKEQSDENPIYSDMVYYYSVEEEAYAICRYLRARKFNLKDTQELVESLADVWKEGQKHGFYPTAAEALGGGSHESAFLTQFPIIMNGLTRNGCPLLYFPVKYMSIEGIECVCPMDTISKYMWHVAAHKSGNIVAKAKEEDPSRFVRMQFVALVDLDGLSISTMRRAMGEMEGCMAVLNAFPEILFSVCITNMPRFFAAFWPLIRAFMDESTASKFELYSNPVEGKKRMVELVDKNELASDFGGNGPTTLEMAARMASTSHKKISRQITKLLTKKAHKSHVDMTFKLERGEAASVSIYTRVSDANQAHAVLSNSNKSEEWTIDLKRNKKEEAAKSFHRDFKTTLHGPGEYIVTVHQKTRQVDYFLVVAEASHEDTS